MKHLGAAIVHADGDADDHGPLGLAQPLQDAVVEVDDLGHGFELAAGHLEGGRVLEDGVGMVNDRGFSGWKWYVQPLAPPWIPGRECLLRFPILPGTEQARCI